MIEATEVPPSATRVLSVGDRSVTLAGPLPDALRTRTVDGSGAPAADDVPADTTWVQWVYEWDAVPGNHTIECRLIDADGTPQVAERTGVRPDGSTGLDSRNVTVT